MPRVAGYLVRGRWYVQAEPLEILPEATADSVPVLPSREDGGDDPGGKEEKKEVETKAPTAPLPAL